MTEEAAVLGGGCVPLVGTLCMIAVARLVAGPNDGLLGGLAKVTSWLIGQTFYWTYVSITGYLMHLILRMPCELLFVFATWWFFKPVFDEGLVLVDRACWAFWYLVSCPLCPLRSAPSTRTALFPTSVYWDYPQDCCPKE